MSEFSQACKKLMPIINKLTKIESGECLTTHKSRISPTLKPDQDISKKVTRSVFCEHRFKNLHQNKIKSDNI